MNAETLLRAEYQRLCAQHPQPTPLDDTQLHHIAKTAHGHFPTWITALHNLHIPENLDIHLDQDTVQALDNHTPTPDKTTADAINTLMPWRKGPFKLLGNPIESEWRSDFKYRRLIELGFNVENKCVLDVGTGNGYFLYRLLGSGAKLACGLDPSWHNFAQFLFLQHYLRQAQAIYIPATLDTAPLSGFDTVISMGVLYHRRDPIAFLTQLRDSLKSGGELVIETLVIDGDAQSIYLPEHRYAGMHNVWFLPSIAALAKWLKRLGFRIHAMSEAIATTDKEQRRTQHMQSHSLAEFMQEHGDQPPPKRAIILAKKP